MGSSAILIMVVFHVDLGGELSGNLGSFLPFLFHPFCYVFLCWLKNPPFIWKPLLSVVNVYKGRRVARIKEISSSGCGAVLCFFLRKDFATDEHG